jgi:hypothetical protein
MLEQKESEIIQISKTIIVPAHQLFYGGVTDGYDPDRVSKP